MRNLMLILLTPLALTACDLNGQDSQTNVFLDCGSAHSTPIQLHYGDSQIKVTAVTKTKRKRTLVFHLHPDKQPTDQTDYETVNVTIEGKTPDAQWINVDGTYDGSAQNQLEVCVPENVAIKVYEYIVKVDGVGQLDPRADVEN
jgi:hypothetical protein